MSMAKTPTWLRVLSVIFGLVVIGLGVAVLFMPNVGVTTLLWMLSLSLLALGSGRIVVSQLGRSSSRGIRVISILAGVADLLLAVAVLVLPQFGATLLVYLLAFALLVHGISRVTVGWLSKPLANWIRG